jgi:Creatinine amidohydrolase
VGKQVAGGYRAVKLQPGDTLKRHIERTLALRSELGPDVAPQADANCRITRLARGAVPAHVLPRETAAEVDTRNPRCAVLPVGSFEQHGPCLPHIADTAVASVITGELARAYGLFALPPVPVSAEKGKAVLTSLTRSFARVLDVLDRVYPVGAGWNPDPLPSVRRRVPRGMRRRRPVHRALASGLQGTLAPCRIAPCRIVPS